MAFPIVKMEDKNPHPPFPLHDVDPHQYSSASAQHMHNPKPTVETLSHTDAIGYNGAPQIRPQKYCFPWTDRQTPLPA